MTLPLFDKASADLPAKLVNALRLGTWRHREELARVLSVSVRQIRDAAHQSRGEILSSQNGLKLTVCATQDELDEAVGRARSQVSEMTNRIVATLDVWHFQTSKSA